MEKAPSEADYGCLIAVIALVIVVGLGVIALNRAVHRFKMASIPSELAVTATIYEAERTGGFGPGGNETGVRVYELDPDSAARLITASGSLLDSNGIRRLVGRADAPGGDYYEWRQTPVDISTTSLEWGQQSEDSGKRHSPRLREYLNVYGFGIPVDAEIERSFDNAINAPGALYAYGGGGAVIVVSPHTRRLFIAYAG